MKTIRIIVSGMQPTRYGDGANGLVLNPGQNDVEVLHWLNLRSDFKAQIDGGHISVDAKEEAAAIKSFRQDCFSSFESAGESEVEAELLPGGRFFSEPFKTFASIWLFNRRISQRDRLISAAERSARWAKYAAIIAAAAAIAQMVFSK